MAQQTINVGTAPNDGTGTPLRTAFQYTNSNFSELYTAVGPSGNNIVVPGTATISGDLTVDTSTLKVDSANNRVGIGTASPALPLEIYKASGDSKMRITSGANSLTIGWDDPNGFYYTANTSLMAWQLSGSTAMTLNSTGLGIGASPTQKLHVKGVVNFEQVSGGTNGWQVYTYTDGTYRMNYNGAGADELIIDTSGNVGIGVQPSAGGGCLQLKSGITFPATQVASSDPNTLDDYEEGSWTPSITFGGASVGMTGTFAGRYTKVGRAVTINGIIALTAKGSSTGIAKIAGLPFTSANASGEYTAISIRLDRVSFADYPCGYVGPNSSVVELENTTNAGTVSSMTDSNFINTSVVIVNFTYTV